MPSIRVLLADDQALFRRAVASLLAAERDFEVVGEAADGQQALEMARELVPDVILMDISMPVMDGLEATRRINAEMPHVRIVILTVCGGERGRFEANRAFETGLSDGVMFERRLFHAMFGTHDQREGMSAFLAKRPAAFVHK